MIILALATLQGGGIQKSAMRLIAEFLRLDIPVSLMTLDSRGPISKEIPEDCVHIDIGVRRTRQGLWKLIVGLKKHQPEVIISAQTHLNVLLIIARFLAGYPRKLIVVEHITFNEEIIYKGKWSERIRPLLIRFFYPFADKVVAVSPASAKSIYQYAKLKKRVDVVWNGLDLDKIQKNASQPASHPWVSNGDFRLILGMGRLSRQKNFSDLLRAFASLEPKENYRLLILGEGPEERALLLLASELGIQKYVEFMGFIENPYPFLAQADLFVLPSKWEGFANVVIESLACGTPIVATDCPGGPADILSKQLFAKIVPMDSPREISIAIQEMLTTEIDTSRILAFAKRFTIQNTVQRYLDLIAEIQDKEV